VPYKMSVIFIVLRNKRWRKFLLSLTYCTFKRLILITYNKEKDVVRLLDAELLNVKYGFVNNWQGIPKFSQKNKYFRYNSHEKPSESCWKDHRIPRKESRDWRLFYSMVLF
jgi:hypothetical protein